MSAELMLIPAFFSSFRIKDDSWILFRNINKKWQLILAHLDLSKHHISLPMEHLRSKQELILPLDALMTVSVHKKNHCLDVDTVYLLGKVKAC